MNANQEKKVLVVDDEHDLADLLGMDLEDEGYNVQVVYGFKEAKEVLESSEDIFLILSDLMMPDGNGEDLFQFTRGLDTSPYFILMSGVNTLSNEDLLSRGMRAFVSKPLKRENLQATIARIFKGVEILRDAIEMESRKADFRKLAFDVGEDAIKIGNGGCFLSIPEGKLPRIEDKLWWSIGESPDSQLFGIVRWGRDDPKGLHSRGIGVEIVCLSEKAEQAVSKFSKGEVAFIPRSN